MRRLIVILTCCIAVLLLAYTSYRGYQVWMESHGISLAKEYLSHSDGRSAFLALQQVLKTNPRNLEASRMVAGLMEVEHSPTALQWRQFVLELNPGSLADRLALAQAAIFYRDYPLATQALAGVATPDKNTVVYHDMAGMAALMGGQAVEAEAHFSESIRLDPSNLVPQMNLAVLRLHRTNALDMAEARIALQRIIINSTNAALRIQARRELVNDAMRFKDFATAENLSKELVQQTNSIFTDKLLRLDVLMKSQNDQFKPTLAVYQSEAGTDPVKISGLTRWRMINLSTTNALGSLQRLPEQSRTNQTVEVLIATCQMQLNDWQGLLDGLQRQNWDDPAHPWSNLEFMRHAFIARTLRGQGLTEASTAEWGVAVKSASDQKFQSTQRDSFKTLFDLSVSWKWNTEAEQILWTVVNQYPEEKWAFPVLRNALITWHRTRSLMQLLATMEKRSPNDLTIKNDLASTALLLGAREAKTYEMAQEVYEKDPTNPYCTSTYAFSLYVQGKNAAALKVMRQLAPQYLQDPSIAPYYGLVLKANGNRTEAKTYLDRASQTQLFPEEQALFDQARAGL